MKSQSIMTQMAIKGLRAIYRHDIGFFDIGHPEHMITAKDIEGAGLCWPLTWLDHVPEDVRDKWHKFMNGQTFCEHGFYERDVRRFLFEVYREG